MTFMDEISDPLPEEPFGFRERLRAAFQGFGRVVSIIPNHSKWLGRTTSVLLLVIGFWLAIDPDAFRIGAQGEGTYFVIGALTYPLVLPALLSWFERFSSTFHALNAVFILLVLLLHTTAFGIGAKSAILYYYILFSALFSPAVIGVYLGICFLSVILNRSE